MDFEPLEFWGLFLLPVPREPPPDRDPPRADVFERVEPDPDEDAGLRAVRAGEDALVAMMGRLVHHPGPDEASTPPGKPSRNPAPYRERMENSRR